MFVFLLRSYSELKDVEAQFKTLLPTAFRIDRNKTIRAKSLLMVHFCVESKNNIKRLYVFALFDSWQIQSSLKKQTNKQPLAQTNFG